MSGSGLDLKDVVGSDNKLNDFINRTGISPDLMLIPKLGEATKRDLNAAGIKNANMLVGQFGMLDFEYTKCVDWIKSTVNFNQSKQIVTVVLYKLESMGFEIPKAPENWRHY